MARYSEVAATQSVLVVPRAAHGRGDPHRLGEEPLDRLPLPEAHERADGGRPGRGGDRDERARGGPARHRARRSAIAFLGGASANDGWSAAERVDLASSPAYPSGGARGAGARAARRTADVDLFDLYSCFPCAIEFALDALGLSRDRPARPDPDRAASHTTAGPATTTRCTAWPTPFCVCGKEKARSAGSRASA